jgi:hypothetical protein
VDSTQLKGILASMVAMAATVAGNFLFAVALSAFVLLESDRLLKILQSATSAHPVMQQMPALMKTAIAYFGIRTRLNLITGVGFTLQSD